MSTHTRPASPLDYYTPTTSPMETDGPRPRNEWNGRLVVKAGDGCCDWLTSIPNAIRRFFIHAYADVRMFFRAFSSMGNGTTPSEIDRRVNEVTQFLTLVENEPSGAGGVTWDFNRVRNRYQRLSPQVRDLFFTVDQHYVNLFGVDQTLWSPQMMRDEMIRESQRVISFQRQLTAVNHFYRLFSGTANQPAETTTSSIDRRRPRTPLPDDHAEETIDEGFLERFWRGLGGEEVREEVTTSTSTNSLNLNVPGTVPYVQNGIPADVQRKADEINNLRDQFADMVANASTTSNAPTIPTVPLIFNDTINLQEFMLIPVFDASHPSVQNALRAASAPGATSEARTALENRDLRHILDKDALEAHITAYPHTAMCPTCRHHVRGMIQRENLRIDTALQDQMLQFLRNAVPAGGATSSTTR